jgi:hypothetical protein
MLRKGIWQATRCGGVAFLSVVMALALASLLAACAQPGPHTDAVRLVERYLTAKQDNDYDTWLSTLWVAHQEGESFTSAFEKPGDLGVIQLRIENVAVSKGETERIRKRYSGSDLAQVHGWSEEYLAENLIAVSSRYTVDYDNTKVPYPEGSLTQYFYLVRDDPDSPWLIWDTSSPGE